MVGSPIVSEILLREEEWANLLNKYFPNAKLLRWGPWHRVYQTGTRVQKIEYKNFVSEDNQKSLGYEYGLLKKLERVATNLGPTFYTVDNSWDVLEMDFIHGQYLDDLFENKNFETSIVKILWKLIRVSISGVAYKQFRGRHIIQKEDGSIEFIDFGHSSNANPLLATLHNFKLFNYTSRGVTPSRLSSIILKIIFGRFGYFKFFKQKPAANSTQLANERWKANKIRKKFALAEYLAIEPGDESAAKNFSSMEVLIAKAIERNPSVAEEVQELKFSKYGIAAFRDWGFIWSYVAQHVVFKNKTLIEINSGMGGLSAYARIVGAKICWAFDENKLLIKASQHCSEAFGICDNKFYHAGISDFFDGTTTLPNSEIICCLSVRLSADERRLLLELSAGYDEILLLSENEEDDFSYLISKNFVNPKRVVTMDKSFSIIHAKKKCEIR